MNYISIYVAHVKMFGLNERSSLVGEWASASDAQILHTHESHFPLHNQWPEKWTNFMFNDEKSNIHLRDFMILFPESSDSSNSISTDARNKDTACLT